MAVVSVSLHGERKNNELLKKVKVKRRTELFRIVYSIRRRFEIIVLSELTKPKAVFQHFPNDKARKQNRSFDEKFSMFWGDFRAKRHFQNDKKIASNKKNAIFSEENEVLAPLTLRFLEKRRRFPTVKTPSFSGRSSICLQDIEIQSFA